MVHYIGEDLGPNSPSHQASNTVEGFMCMIDWQHELGHASNGTRVYPSLEALKRNHIMWEECGIIKVRVSLIEEVVPQNLRDDDVKLVSSEDADMNPNSQTPGD